MLLLGAWRGAAPVPLAAGAASGLRATREATQVIQSRFPAAISMDEQPYVIASVLQDASIGFFLTAYSALTHRWRVWFRKRCQRRAAGSACAYASQR